MLGMDGGLLGMQEVGSRRKQYRRSANFGPQFKPSSIHSFHLASIWR